MSIQRDISHPPLPDRTTLGDWAIFLDLDGTLIDLAPTPDSVSVPKDLVETLAVLRTELSGALAIISGRAVAIIDDLMQPLRLTAAGQHGAEIRFSGDSALDSINDTRIPEAWRQAVFRLAQDWPGALIEEKSHGLAVHYRANPALEGKILSALETIVSENQAFEVLPAAMAREIRHRDANKGAALRRLMARAPFSERRPLFIGDDVTDEDAIAAAAALGGCGLRVPEHFGGQPALVRDWLRSLSGRV